MTATALLTVRVTVTDAWDRTTLTVPPDTTIDEVRRRALEATLGTAADADRYAVKFRGGFVHDLQRTLADLGVPDGAPLIVLAERRRPVR